MFVQSPDAVLQKLLLAIIESGPEKLKERLTELSGLPEEEHSQIFDRAMESLGRSGDEMSKHGKMNHVGQAVRAAMGEFGWSHEEPKKKEKKDPKPRFSCNFDPSDN